MEIVPRRQYEKEFMGHVILYEEFLSKKNEKDQSEKDRLASERWSKYLSDEESINYCRKLLGLDPITKRLVRCKKCSRHFESQFLGSVRQENFCRDHRFQGVEHTKYRIHFSR
jgi:hypothetical protein